MSLLKNKIPVKRRKKELFVIFFISIISISMIFIYTYIINSPMIITDIPRINITYDSKPDTEDYEICTFELVSENPEENIDPMESKIKQQGSPASWRKKKSYRLELSQPKSLLGMRKDDDWVLMSMFLDFPRMRTKLSIDLWRSLETLNPNAILPNSKYVSVYINGEFHGLYLLAEKIDRRLFDLDDPLNNLDSSLIIQAKYSTNFQEYIVGRWEQDWPNEDDGIYIMEDIMIELIEFVNNSDDDEFFNPETGVYSIFDKLSLIDLYLFNYFILHQDFWYKNYYLIRNTNPNKFYFIPWDFDASFGQSGWFLYDSDTNLDSHIIYHHKLFNRLLNNKEFRVNCKKRWFYLRENLWTDQYILDMLSEIYDEIREILKFEMRKWEPETVDEEPEDHYLYSTENFELNKYIESLYEFIPERLEFCDNHYREF